jgi:lipid-A-disaccharide synthase
MRALKRRYPDARFLGIGGPAMATEGLEQLVSMDRLAVNGFVDPIRRLPDLLGIIRLLLRTYAEVGPDLFIGIDFNVFNLLLERRLKRRGIPTVHYVSPSVYAWRRGRVRRVARAANVLLTLFPFEPELYRHTRVNAVFVGHPLADAIADGDGDERARLIACRELGIDPGGTPIAVLPGSRMSEIRMLGDRFLDAAQIVQHRLPGARFIVPCVRPQIAEWVAAAHKARPQLSLTSYQGNARVALTACKVALVKSGTSTLEAMLLGRPMVVSYRLGPVTYQLVRMLLRTPFVALPNILAGRALVPELLQNAATPERLADTLLAELDKSGVDPEYLSEFRRLGDILRRDANARAAEVVSRCLEAENRA